jgi:hypothetical protein
MIFLLNLFSQQKRKFSNLVQCNEIGLKKSVSLEKRKKREKKVEQAPLSTDHITEIRASPKMAFLARAKGDFNRKNVVQIFVWCTIRQVILIMRYALLSLCR